MGRTAKSVNEMAAEKLTSAADLSETENNEVKEVIEKKVNKVSSVPLKDSDEIEIMSLIPNVSYKDNKTGDMYEWEESGHIEIITFETLKNLWRNHKGYFRNMWLKPKDDRVINQFGLTNIFKKYDMLMDDSSYTRDNIDKICSAISEAPNGLKRSIFNRVKDLVVTEKLTDVFVIRALEKHLKVDLISFLN